MIQTREAISEKAVLIGIITQQQDEKKSEEYLDELDFLTQTAGGIPVKRFVQKMDKPHPKTFLGSGKLEDVRMYIISNRIGTAIVLDRTNLILDIFANRAQTSSAKAQVELAQYQYLLPRLTKMWTHLDKQKGGIGMRGPGETNYY